MAQETQVRRILVRFDTQGDKSLKDIKNGIASMNKEIKSSGNILRNFESIFTGVLGAGFLGVSIQSITGVADAMQKLGDRLTTMEGSAEAGKATLKNLGEIANATNTSIEDLGTVYFRLRASMDDLGLSSDAVLGVTTALQQSFRLSGSTAAEATAATIQLSQGLASGQLRGQELRSVLEQNVVVGEILTKTLGVSRGELIKFAESGKITSQVVLKALADNFSEINERAQKLQPTIQEGMTRAFNDLKLQIKSFNEEVQGTQKAISAIEFLGDNLKVILSFLAALATYAAIPKILLAVDFAAAILVKTIGLLAVNFVRLFAILAGANPITLTAIAIGSLLAYIIDWDKALDTIKENLKSAFPSLELWRTETEKTQEATRKLAEANERAAKSFKAMAPTGNNLFDDISGNSLVLNNSGLGNFMKDLAKDFDAPLMARIETALKNSLKTLKEKKVPEDFSKSLKALNERFNEGKVSVLDYNVELLRITEGLNKKKGPVIMFKEMNKALEGNLNRSFEEGALSLAEYTTALKALEAAKLEDGFKKGYVSVSEYHRELVKVSDTFKPGSALYVGTESFLEKIGTTSQNVAGMIENTFSRLEDSLLEFIKNGKFSFKEFSMAIIEDINRIILRALIIRPLAQGILGVAGANGQAMNESFGHYQDNALGGAYSNGTKFFANGGIVNRTTSFGMSGGKTGIMGEAGPEAILPLERGPGGKLGVNSSSTPVVVNIVNNAGAEVTQSETTGPDGSRVLDIIIATKVKEGIANGSYDRTFQQAYGLRRKGS